MERSAPPHDEECEKSILSHVMLADWTNRDLQFSVLAKDLRPEDFYVGSHGHIWEAARSLAAVGRPTDVVSIATWLKEQGKIDQVGGIQALTEMLNSAPVVMFAVLENHIRKVQETARLRQALAVCQEAEALMYSGEIPSAGEFGTSLVSRLNKIFLDGRGSSKRFLRLTEIIPEVRRRIGDVKLNGSRGIPTGMRAWDDLSTGNHDGDLTVVAGRPGMGKTGVANCMALACASMPLRLDEPQRVPAIVSLEMPDAQLIGRMGAAGAKVSPSSLRSGNFRANGYGDFMDELTRLERGYDIRVLDGRFTGDAIIAQLRQLAEQLKVEKKRLGTVIIDHLNIVKLEPKKNQTISHCVGEFTAALKELAKELQCPIILLCQLNREVEKRADRRPMISDLRESGSIEQDADNIVFLYRDDYYNKQSDRKGWLEAIFAKQRDGATGTANVGFEAEFVRLWDREEDSKQEETHTNGFEDL